MKRETIIRIGELDSQNDVITEDAAKSAILAVTVLGKGIRLLRHLGSNDPNDIIGHIENFGIEDNEVKVDIVPYKPIDPVLLDNCVFRIAGQLIKFHGEVIGEKTVRVIDDMNITHVGIVPKDQDVYRSIDKTKPEEK